MRGLLCPVLTIRTKAAKRLACPRLRSSRPKLSGSRCIQSCGPSASLELRSSVPGFSVHRLTDQNDHQNIIKLLADYSVTRYSASVLIGKDEFHNDSSKTGLLAVSDTFSVCENSTSSTVGYIVLTHSSLFGTSNDAFADMRILPSRGWSTRNSLGSFSKLLDIATDLSKQLHYDACIYESFLCNSEILAMLRTQRFNIIAVLPRSGYVFDLGWQDNVVLMKEHTGIQVYSLLYCIYFFYSLICLVETSLYSIYFILFIHFLCVFDHVYISMN